MRKETTKSKIKKRIVRKKGDVFLRKDFGDLGGYDQVGRILKQLVADGKLIKLGQGLYARTARSPFDGRPIPVRGLRTVREALNRLGVETGPTKIEQDYNAGRTTQVPTGRVIGVNKLIRRKLGYNGWQARFERV
jgi:hypothetical protein